MDLSLGGMPIDKVAAVAALASFQLYSCYSTAAPSLQDLRSAAPGDIDTMNKLNDADYMVGGLCLFIGGAIYVATKSAVPLAFLAIGFIILSSYHHLTRRAAQ